MNKARKAQYRKKREAARAAGRIRAQAKAKPMIERAAERAARWQRRVKGKAGT
jgi:hypothetical protein